MGVGLGVGLGGSMGVEGGWCDTLVDCVLFINVYASKLCHVNNMI